MFKVVIAVFAAIMGVAFAVPNPNPKPGLLAYSAPAVAYSAPLAYSAPVAYASPSVVSAYGAAPLAYSAYGSQLVY